MKKLILFIILGFLGVLFSFKGISQTSSIIINSSSDSVYFNSVNGWLIPGGYYNTYYYRLDLDWNGIPDFTFSSSCYYGGSSAWASMNLQSGDNSFFSVEKVIETSGYYGGTYGNECIHYTDSVSIVRVYNESDTVRQIDCNVSSQHTLTNYEYYSGQYPCLIHAVDYWGSVPNFIGIKKRINNIDYLGWIKISVPSYQTIEIIEYAMNNSIVNVAEQRHAEDLVFPNPVGSELCVKAKECRRIEILNVYGEIVESADYKTGESQFKMNVGSLTPGLYLVRVYEKDKFVTRKIIKT